MILKNPPFSAIEQKPGLNTYFMRLGAYRIWFYLPDDMPDSAALAKVEAWKHGEQEYIELIQIAS